MKKHIPGAKFMQDMGVASIIAGVVLLAVAQVVKRAR